MDPSMIILNIRNYSVVFWIALLLAVTRAIFPTCRKFRAVEMASGIM